MSTPRSSKPDRVAGLKRDMYYLRRFPHPNVVQVFGAYEENGTLYMVMEYLPYSLRNKSVVNKMNILRAISDVARALVRLHSAGQLHRDVKARNVLVTAGFKSAKLCDFGLARALPDPSREEVNPTMTPDIGPPKYRAPEVRRTPTYDVQSDIYGYGVMCKQLLAQLRESTRESIGEEDLAFVERLADDCTNHDRKRRPTAYECLQRCLDQRGRAIQLCSKDTASRRSRYWLDAPMDGGTWKRKRIDAESSDEETPSDRSGSDEDAADAAERGEKRGEKRGEGREEETPGEPGRGSNGANRDDRRGKKRRREAVEEDSSGRDATRGATTRGDGEDEEEVEQRAR